MLVKPNRLVIAIDGPAGAGKTTVAKLVSAALKIKYIESGAVYRTVTYLALKNNIELTSTWQLIALIDKINMNNHLKVIPEQELRSQYITDNVCYIANNALLRKKITEKLRSLGKNNCVMEGRDITTEVYPDADLKIFLDAKIEERALRRYEQLKKDKTEVVRLKILKERLQRRDKEDMERQVGPLIKSNEAVYLDTTLLTPQEVANIIIKMVKNIYKKNHENKLFYILYLLSIPLFKLLFRLEVIGRENIPFSGGLIVACNHVSFLDPVIIGAALNRQPYFLARHDLFTIPLLGFIIRKLNALPIKRDGFDKSFLEKAYKILSEGKVLVLFPEGTRSKDATLLPFKMGLAMIIKYIDNTNFGVICAKISGTEIAMPYNACYIRPAHIKVKFSKFIHASELNNYDYKKITEIIYNKLKEL